SLRRRRPACLRPITVAQPKKSRSGNEWGQTFDAPAVYTETVFTQENSMASHPAAQVPARAPSGAASKRGTLCVRDATAQDMDAVQRIYAHHVLHGTATFEEQPPTVEEMLARRQQVLDLNMPYLVAEVDGQVVGYAYAAPYRP